MQCKTFSIWNGWLVMLIVRHVTLSLKFRSMRHNFGYQSRFNIFEDWKEKFWKFLEEIVLWGRWWTRTNLIGSVGIFCWTLWGEWNWWQTSLQWNDLFTLVKMERKWRKIKILNLRILQVRYCYFSIRQMRYLYCICC